jgi:hypothetical protein
MFGESIPSAVLRVDEADCGDRFRGTIAHAHLEGSV